MLRPNRKQTIGIALGLVAAALVWFFRDPFPPRPAVPDPNGSEVWHEVVGLYQILTNIRQDLEPLNRDERWEAVTEADLKNLVSANALAWSRLQEAMQTDWLPPHPADPKCSDWMGDYMVASFGLGDSLKAELQLADSADRAGLGLKLANRCFEVGRKNGALRCLAPALIDFRWFREGCEILEDVLLEFTRPEECIQALQMLPDPDIPSFDVETIWVEEQRYMRAHTSLKDLYESWSVLGEIPWMSKAGIRDQVFHSTDKAFPTLQETARALAHRAYQLHTGKEASSILECQQALPELKSPWFRIRIPPPPTHDSE